MNETTHITTGIRYKQSHLAGRGWSGQKMNRFNAGESNKKEISVRKKSCGEIMNANLFGLVAFLNKTEGVFYASICLQTEKGSVENLFLVK